ncbi:hypothetical protein LCGC14_1835580, partial [marine sediment metagenome]
ITLSGEVIAGGGQPMETLPDQYGPRVPILQPGRYRFKLPADTAKIYEPIPEAFEAVMGTDEKAKVGCMMMVFDSADPLMIVQSPQGTRDGEAFQTRVTNIKRFRNKEHTVLASDLDYLLRILGEMIIPNVNAAYITALSKYGGKEFSADVEATWTCSDKRDIYAILPGTEQVQQIMGVKGTGKTYRADTDVHRNEEGQYPEEIDVVVQGTDPATQQPVTYTAIVRAFNNLTRFYE